MGPERVYWGMLHQLVYVSRAIDGFSKADAEAIVATAERRNHAIGVTGALLFADGQFLQLLEGGLAQINEVFDGISRDARHQSVYMLDVSPIAERAFVDWRMRLVFVSGAGDSSWQRLCQRWLPGPGYDPRLLDGRSARALLQAAVQHHP